MEKAVITTTGIPAGKVTDGVIEAVSKFTPLATEPVGEVKKGLKPGRHYFLHDNGKLTVYTVDMVDVEAKFKASNDTDKFKYFADGYKRQEVNRGNHEAVKATLGLKEPTKKAAVAEQAELASLHKAVGTGLKDVTQLQLIYRLLTKETIEAAIKSRK